MPSIEVRLYASNGSTFQQILPNRRGLRVTEEFNGLGYGQVTVPAATADAILKDQVIKVAYDGTIVAAFICEKRSRAHTDSDGLKWVTLEGRGLGAWLEDAVIWPQSGILSSYVAPERPFNFAGKGGSFETRVTWVRPLGFKQKDATDYRKGYPLKWPDPNAYWIWKTNPASTVASNARNWMRTDFTVSTSRKVKIYASADNYFDLYLDGALILSTGDLRGEGSSWKKLASRTITITAGSHRLAAYVTNGGNASASNKAGFLCSVLNIDSDGKPTTVIRHTDKSTWWVTDTEPKFYPAEILQTLIEEQRARAAAASQTSRLNNFTMSWSFTVDTSSRSWTTAIAKTFPVGQNLVDTMHELVDHGVDFWLDPATNALKGYETRGSDKSTAILLKLKKNLNEYETSALSTGKNQALVRSADGWTQAVNTTGVTADGRRETFLEVGNTKSETTAAAVASRVLARTAKTTVAVDRVSITPTADARPFIDYAPGDRVTTYSSTGAKTTGRVLSLTLLENDDKTLSVEPELEVLV